MLGYGLLTVKIDDFNVNKEPNKSSKYPVNLINASNEMSQKIFQLWKEIKPDHVVIEQTVKRSQ